MWFMILMLALAGAFAASMQSNDLLLLALAAAVGAAIGFAAYDIPRRATAAIAPGFVGGPFIRWFANLVRAFAGVMADIALWLTVAISALFLWAMWKSSGYDQATGFPDPAFSPQSLARKVGVTTRYIQDLLHETGASFTDRVVELRLQRARTMLADPGHDRLKVGEIAAACGFNEIPHFNRCFRRRFGATPTQVRGRAAA